MIWVTEKTEQFEQWFQTKGKPVLQSIGAAADIFQQKAADALFHRWLFWPVLTLAGIGLVAVVRWVL